MVSFAVILRPVIIVIFVCYYYYNSVSSLFWFYFCIYDIDCDIFGHIYLYKEHWKQCAQGPAHCTDQSEIWHIEEHHHMFALLSHNFTLISAKI